MILATAGLLDGYEATTHWSFLPCFARFPKIRVAAGYPRFIVDRDRVTGGGISSGLDEGPLGVIALLRGEDAAKNVQLTIQYHPQPPFQWGDPAAGGDAPGDVMPDLRSVPPSWPE